MGRCEATEWWREYKVDTQREREKGRSNLRCFVLVQRKIKKQKVTKRISVCLNWIDNKETSATLNTRHHHHHHQVLKSERQKVSADIDREIEREKRLNFCSISFFFLLLCCSSSIFFLFSPLFGCCRIQLSGVDNVDELNCWTLSLVGDREFSLIKARLVCGVVWLWRHFRFQLHLWWKMCFNSTVLASKILTWNLEKQKKLVIFRYFFWDSVKIQFLNSGFYECV